MKRRQEEREQLSVLGSGGNHGTHERHGTMNRKRGKAKKRASHATEQKQALKAGQTARQRKGWISPEQARRLAAQRMMSEMFDGVPVLDGMKVRPGAHNYRVPRKGVWLVFPKIVNRPSGFYPSTIVVVCKRTGRVLCVGSAHDEG